MNRGSTHFSGRSTWSFDWFRDGYVGATRQFLRLGVMVMLIYAGMIGLTVWDSAPCPSDLFRRRIRVT